MLTLNPEQTVGDLVRQSPNRARVFESLKIDYCCGGKVSLDRACQKRGIDTAEVMERIHANDATLHSDSHVDVDSMTLTELADHIETTHHAYLREELPRLDAMTEKVSRVHGDKDARLHQMREAFVALKSELEPHMMKEEQILFPIVRQLESSSDQPEFFCGSVANPIRQMEHEHDQAGNALAVLNESTDGYAPPEWACNTYRAMLDSLARLEADMHQHIHKENNVLFVKALAL
ncbi:iron-sulfur cluster repair di-iron protein [Rhodopirellula sallentina]|uniref:Hemerythrin HHE cation-binding domain-containing protein n=1 Tax=Rhodopirellula sallentina SM41 TaxID=1263870 RepID=M5U7X1_9BACT|nr:iron-sulfur cluster repair di-iron protein [Rhodopirellula sallentina]EMI53966.1 hemerythrin HHE cation-binding domain-containing protein [Rhodopirellula sallentina SM41]